jgi:hypothetical protein
MGLAAHNADGISGRESWRAIGDLRWLFQN